MMAAFAGMAPAPPPPKPPREIAECSQIAEDPDGLKLDPEFIIGSAAQTTRQD